MLMRSQGRAAWRRFNEARRGGPRARARGARRRAGDLRRRAAADPGLHHRHLRRCCSCSRRRARWCGGCSCAGDAPHDGSMRVGRSRPRARRAGARATTTSRAPPSTSTATGSPRRLGASRAARRRRARRRRHRRGHVRLRRPGGRALRARAARARAAPTARGQRAGGAVRRPRAGRGARPRRRRGGRRAPAGTRSSSPALRDARSRRRSTRWTVALRRRGRRRASSSSSRRPAPPAELARRRAVARSAAWRATSSSAACAGRCAPAAASGGRRASASAATPGATRTGTGSRSRARRARGPDGGPRVALTASARRAPQTTPTRRSGRALLGARRRAARSTTPRLSTTYDGDGHQRRAGPRAVGRRGGRLPAPRRRRGAVRLVARARRAAARLRVLPLAPRGPRGRRPLRHPARARRDPAPSISDFGGVLTAPLMDGVRAHPGRHSACRRGVRARDGADAAARRRAPAVRARARRDHRGASSSPRSSASSSRLLGRTVDAARLRRALMAALDPNEELFAYYRALRDERGLRLAMLHEQRARVGAAAGGPSCRSTRSSRPSSTPRFVGMRKPEPEIYAIVLERLGAAGRGVRVRRRPRAQRRRGARRSGFAAVHFRDTAQAIAELDALLA